MRARDIAYYGSCDSLKIHVQTWDHEDLPDLDHLIAQATAQNLTTKLKILEAQKRQILRQHAHELAGTQGQ